MLEKLTRVEKRFEEVNALLCSSDVASDIEKYTSLMKELKQLTPVVEKFRELKRAEETRDEALLLLEGNEADGEFKEMLREELDEAKKQIVTLTQELKVLLLPKDPNDDRNVIVEIRGGAGGEESALFAYDLFRMYSMYAESKGFRIEVMNLNETELGGIKEISFMINGEGAYSRFKFESGVHRVQRVPETESGGRIHTSTVTVAVLPEAQEVEFELDPADLVFEVYRASGAGGQKVNKTSSAVRVIHVPTGTVVECQVERSQYQNKDRAVELLRSRLYNEECRKQQEAIDGERRSQVGTGDRSERIRTYNFPQGRVTDHRIGLTLYKLDSILNGDLDEVIDALITADTAKKMENSGDGEA